MIDKLDKAATEALRDIIHSIPSAEEARLAAAGARYGAEQVMQEWAREDPVIAAEMRLNRRRRKAWQRERDRLCAEVSRLQTPLLVVALMSEAEPERDAACAVLKVTDYLFENDAPAELIRELLRAVKHWIPE